MNIPGMTNTELSNNEKSSNKDVPQANSRLKVDTLEMGDIELRIRDEEQELE